MEKTKSSNSKIKFNVNKRLQDDAKRRKKKLLVEAWNDSTIIDTGGIFSPL